MSKLVRRWLNDDRLRTEYGGRYTGTIADVALLPMRNKFRRGAESTEPTIHFADGELLVPNQRMRADLVAWLGAESDHWRGTRIVVYRQAIQYTDRDTGAVKVRYEKRAERAETARVVRPAFERGAAWADAPAPIEREREPGEDDDIEEPPIAATGTDGDEPPF